MLSAICFNVDQCKISSSGNGLMANRFGKITGKTGLREIILR